MTMDQPQRNHIEAVHDVVTPAINLNMCAGDIDITRLCIYNNLKE